MVFLCSIAFKSYRRTKTSEWPHWMTIVEHSSFVHGFFCLKAHSFAVTAYLSPLFKYSAKPFWTPKRQFFPYLSFLELSPPQLDKEGSTPTPTGSRALNHVFCRESIVYADYLETTTLFSFQNIFRCFKHQHRPLQYECILKIFKMIGFYNHCYTINPYEFRYSLIVKLI